MTDTRKHRDVVLVVDDSPDTLGMLNDVLDGEGLTVLVALEGTQALTIAGNISPDIILLDALMPGMDGFETCRQLKANPRLAHIPVIFMTGLSDSDSVVRGFEAGGVDYVTKPVDSDVLLVRMRAHLANARHTQSARAALDSAGHFLLATDSRGRLLWATPQARDLFERAGASAAWIDSALPGVVAALFDARYNRDRPLAIATPRTPLELRYLGQTGADEYLLRLVDLAGPSDTEMLRDAFALTEREAEVLLWVGKGKANREIALILAMSPRTVNKHLEQIFRKLGVDNRTSAAALSLRHLNR